MNKHGLFAQGSAAPLALQGVEVSAHISGFLVETRLTQHYQNDSASNLELAYTFPLPVDAVLLGFTVQIGARTFTGEVIPRSQAEADYEEAIAQGHSAFRLQQLRPGLYNAALGNVMAGEAVAITVTYAETLAWNGNSLRYRLPTTIAPRYGEPVGMEPWQRPETSLQAAYTLKLKLRISGALARSSVRSPSHSISFHPHADSLEVNLAPGASLDRDFILELERNPEQDTPQPCLGLSVAVSASARDTHIAMLTLLPPLMQSAGQQRDVVLILDCSGSMQGDSLDLAKEGIRLALDSMQPSDRFGLIAFGSHAISFDRQLQPANRKNLSLAQNWVQSLTTMGGTELPGAIDLALTYHHGQPLDFLLLTDGEVWLDAAVCAAHQQKGIRIFTLGIGSAVAQDVVQHLADATGGACELVSPTEDMASRIQRHFQRLRQPRMQQLEIHWPGNPPVWIARPARACFAGDAHTLFAAFAAPPEGMATIRFNWDDEASQELQLPLTPDTSIADAIVRLGARQQLPHLPQAEQQAWAVRYQLMSEQTDYLIKLERAAAEQATDLPELQIQPQMLPAGWGGTSTVRHNKSRSRALFSVASPTGIDYSALAEAPAIVRRRGRIAPLGMDTLSSYEIPAFLRCASADSPSCAGPYIDLLEALQQQPKLPGTCAELQQLPAMPEALNTLLSELLNEQHAEADILRALYQALIDAHPGPAMDTNLRRRLQRHIRKAPPLPALVARIRAKL